MKVASFFTFAEVERSPLGLLSLKRKRHLGTGTLSSPFGSTQSGSGGRKDIENDTRVIFSLSAKKLYAGKNIKYIHPLQFEALLFFYHLCFRKSPIL
ncbi:MAG: hypothetical protein IKD18_07350 [Clostridia bacterium]|nr:hypothetical protein [Clostridia bacterium]